MKIRRNYKFLIISMLLLLIFKIESIVPVKALEINGFDIKGNTREELINQLDNRINEWKKNPLIIKGENTYLEIPTHLIHFQSDLSIDKFMKSNKKRWYNFLSEKYAGKLHLHVELNEEILKSLDKYYFLPVDKIKDELLLRAKLLEHSPIEVVENKNMLENMPRVSFGQANVEQDVNDLQLFVDAIDGLILNPLEKFSLISFATEQELVMDSNLMSFMATVMNQAVMRADFEVVEQHIGQDIPQTGEPGLDANINLLKDKDYQIINTSEFPVLVRASINNNKLLVSLHSFDDRANYFLTIKKEIVAYKTIYRYSNKLTGNQQRLLMAGKSGLAVNIVQVESRGIFESEKNIRRAYYPPINQIIEIAAELADNEEEINDDGHHEELVEDIERKDPEEVDRDINGQPVSPAIDEQPLTDKGGNLINEK